MVTKQIDEQFLIWVGELKNHEKVENYAFLQQQNQ